VEACAVVKREGEWLAYVVAGGALDARRLAAHMAEHVEEGKRPVAYMPVARLPMTEQGEVDEEVLRRVEVLEEGVVRRWEEALKAVEGVEEAAVVVGEEEAEPEVVHLSELVADWKGSARQEEVGAVVRTGKEERQEEEGRPALSEGGTLELEEWEPKTLPQALRRVVREAPQRGMVYVDADGGERRQSYAQLLEDAQHVLGGLRAQGVKAGDKVIMQVEDNRDFLVVFWGCVLCGAVPVPLAVAPSYEPGNAAVGKLHNAWKLLEGPVIVASDEVVEAVREVGRKLGADWKVAPVRKLQAAEPDTRWHESQPDDLAVLLLTSGSTGMPKGVMQKHLALMKRCSATAKHNGFTAKDVSFNWMPMDHVGGVVMFHLMDVYLTSMQVHAPTQAVLQQPLRWLDCMEKYGATVTWAPNFAFALINDRAQEVEQRRWDLSRMRFIVNAGEAIVAKTARRFLSLLEKHGLPKTAMRPVWGMSETCSGVTFSNRFTLETTRDEDVFVEVGGPLPGIALRIVDGKDQVLKEGKIGRLQVKGVTVLEGYFRNPEANRDSYTKDGWFITGDLGVLREGRLTITGREKDVIIINGINYHAQEIESVVEEVKGVEVSFTAACAVREAGTNTDKLAVFFNTARTGGGLAELLKEIRDHMVRVVGISPHYLVPVEKETIPKTGIGKIQRADLRKRFEKGEFDGVLEQVDLLTRSGRVVPEWFFQRAWERKELGLAGPAVEGRGLVVLVDKAGLGEALLARLPGAVGVEAGEGFARVSTGRYRIDPAQGAQYGQLLEALRAEGVAVREVVHLWTYGPGRVEGKARTACCTW
jgi:acyl-CoA synthetase (AMP-forming)/AMP-acid ligase II